MMDIAEIEKLLDSGFIVNGPVTSLKGKKLGSALDI